ncbi:MAG: hypothetical protein AAFZ07_26155 [Actinomycetota bacterium]
MAATAGSSKVIDTIEPERPAMFSRTLLVAPVAAVAVAVTMGTAGAAVSPNPTPAPLGDPAFSVAAGPTAVLDLPDELHESDLVRTIRLDDSTSDGRNPIVEQRLVIREPDGDRSVVVIAGGPGPHATTEVTHDEHGTWRFTLTVTSVFGHTDRVTETVEVVPDLSEPAPDNGGDELDA